MECILDKDLSVNIQNSQSAFKFQYELHFKKDENRESKISNFSKNMSNY